MDQSVFKQRFESLLAAGLAPNDAAAAALLELEAVPARAAPRVELKASFDDDAMDVDEELKCAAAPCSDELPIAAELRSAIEAARDGAKPWGAALSIVWSTFSSIDVLKDAFGGGEADVAGSEEDQSPSATAHTALVCYELIFGAQKEALENALGNALEALSSELSMRQGDRRAAVAWCVVLQHPLIADAQRAPLLRSAFVSLGACGVEGRRAFGALARRCGAACARKWGALAQDQLTVLVLGGAEHAELLHAARVCDAMREIDSDLDDVCAETNDVLNDRLAEDERLVVTAYRAWRPEEPREVLEGDASDALFDPLRPPPKRRRYRRLRHAGTSLLSYEYLLDAASKARLLRAESRLAMRASALDEYRRTLETGERHASPYFVVAVRRDELVPDALRKLVGAKDDELRKQLKVAFRGEEGVDEGGVANEFMQIATRSLLTPTYGMFEGDAESNALWFSRSSFESMLEFELVGILLGIAIYNSILVDAPFAKALWKKLAGEPLGLEDLHEAMPAVSRSLQAILKAARDSSDQAFHAAYGDLCFEASYEAFGAPQTAELVAGGADIPLSRANARAYVDAYVEWTLGAGVAPQFNAFKKGFDRVVAGHVWRLLSPRDLELLVRGSPTLDFAALESNATYEDGYDEDSETIKHFWEVVHTLDDDQRRKMLKFVTGSDRAPINGLGSARFVISRTGATDQLPSSHTCFQHLVLPDYKQLQMTREKLIIAINESEGFGLR